MKLVRTLAFATILAVSTVSLGCASWLQQFKENPVVTAQNFINDTTAVVNRLTDTFNGIVPFLSPDKQVTARKTWADAIFTLNNSEQVLLSSIQAWMDGKSGNIAGSIADVVSAVASISAIVHLFQADPSIASNPAVPQQLKADFQSHQFYTAYISRYGKK
jgi:hypothetical protein